MVRPDLNDDAKIATYRAELRAVGRNQRLAGFALVILGAVAEHAGHGRDSQGETDAHVGHSGPHHDAPVDRLGLRGHHPSSRMRAR